jgi:septin 7
MWRNSLIETKVVRVESPDTRIHACLYFLAPTGHGLKPLDIRCMKKIHKKVNIIPVIGKADTFTKAETAKFKTTVRSGGFRILRYFIYFLDF